MRLVSDVLYINNDIVVNNNSVYSKSVSGPLTE